MGWLRYLLLMYLILFTSYAALADTRTNTYSSIDIGRFNMKFLTDDILPDLDGRMIMMTKQT